MENQSYCDENWERAKTVDIALKQIIVIDQILNNKALYIKSLGIQKGDKIELSFVLSSNWTFGYSHKINIKNLRSGLEKKDVVPKNAWKAFALSFEYHETI